MFTFVKRLLARPWLLLAIALLCLTVVACGGGDDDDDDSADDAATSQTTDAGDDDSSDDGDDDEATDEPTDEPSGDDDDDGSSDVEACSLVTPDEINAITGSDYDVVQAEGNQCTYEDSAAHGIYVILEGESGYEINLEALGGDEFDGPGDRTVWSPGFYTLNVLDGDRTITVQVVDFSDEARDEAIAIADEILD